MKKENVVDNLIDHAVCFGTRFKHYKGGMYVGICEAIREVDGVSVIVYQSEATGDLFTRPLKEFYAMVPIMPDGAVERFVPVGMAR